MNTGQNVEKKKPSDTADVNETNATTLEINM